MKAPRRRVSPYPRRSKSGGRKEGHNRDKQDQVIQTTNGRFVSCVSLCFPCYAQGAEIHEIFGKGKRFSERAHTSLILGLVCDVVELIPRYEHSGYTKQLSWVDQQVFQVRKVEFYDRRGDLLKTLQMEDYQLYADKYWRAGRLSMVNHQTRKETNLIFSDYRFGLGLKDSDFVRGALRRIR